MGLWVEVDSDLPEHPKSLRLAEILGEPRAWARVVQLWMWAVRYAPSGDLSAFTPGQIARAMGYEKGGPDNGADPVAALRECGVTGSAGDHGFLDSDNKLHGWNERTGGKLKKRQRVKRLNRKRQSRYRHALVTREKRTVPDLTVPDLTVPDLTVPDLTVPDQLPHPLPPPKGGGRARSKTAACPDCGQILAEFNRLAATSFNGAGRAKGFMHARHREHGVEVCFAVMAAKIPECLLKPETVRWANPETVFRAGNFERVRGTLEAAEKNPEKLPAWRQYAHRTMEESR